MKEALRKFKRDFILFFAACQLVQTVIIILASSACRDESKASVPHLHDDRLVACQSVSIARRERSRWQASAVRYARLCRVSDMPHGLAQQLR
jgi:hypothetical protein